ncbi:hypothetical protein AWB68_07266 [Caballeronia choica]|uniref:Uncharacterized protein n=2 Tax=Caballeronia choica TaxID=326476 RepID=A0A158KT76_9BURK|nr:hypothetical protein AWB68_07266 [Caballeronia choica]
MTELKRVVQWMKSLVSPQASAAPVLASPLDFDPVWHGDHWQNLLSSPMDARHYVMEDWTLPFQHEHELAGDAPSESAERKAA